jgi:signal transduction histidine kinase
MMQFPRHRIPVWAPLAVTLAIIVGLAAEAYPELILTLDASTIGRKYPDVRLLRKVFTSPVPLEIEDEYIQRRVIRDAISGLHRQTYARVGRLTDGKYKKIIDNSADIKNTVPDTVVTEGLRLVDTTQIYESAQGLQFRLEGVHYHVIATRFPLTKTENQGGAPYTGRILLITNLDKATQKAREILTILSTRILVTIGLCTSASILIIILPLLRIDRLIRLGQTPTVQWWAPIQYEKLATQLRLDQAANIKYRGKAEEAAAIANATINGISDAIIFLKNADGVYLLCNDAFTAIAGRDPIGLKDSDLVWTAADTEKYRAEDAGVIATGEPISILEQIGGEVDSHWHLTRKVRVSIESQPAVLGISLDVDELVKARRAAEHYAKQIEENQRIWRHDLLSTAKGVYDMFELLDIMGFEIKEEGFADTYAMARKASESCYNLIKETRKLGVAEDELKIRPYSVKEIFSDTVPNYTQYNVIINFPAADDFVLIDRAEFVNRALYNLINNAIRYSNPPNERVELFYKVKGDRGYFVIKDNGIGISPDGIEKVLNGMGEGVRLNPEIPGTGLGLYSVRRILAAHGGELTARSKVGEGSVFIASVPRKLS